MLNARIHTVEKQLTWAFWGITYILKPKIYNEAFMMATLLWKDYCKKDMCTQKIPDHFVKLWSVVSGIKWAMHLN